ncbi:MAG: hypothetical protein KY392_03735, partial [Chloroflexi bacterium]|nr:hypothetical protein [Chloroflexota bacterium]
NVVATLFPLLMLGLLGLYLLWLLVGYLRVSQVGIHEGREGREAIPLVRPAQTPELETTSEPARLETAPGAPYCPVDGLQYPAGARYCTQCERDLVLDCSNCGATVNASEASCYRCGTPTATAEGARTH